jgi:hypothetical protein
MQLARRATEVRCIWRYAIRGGIINPGDCGRNQVCGGTKDVRLSTESLQMPHYGEGSLAGNNGIDEYFHRSSKRVGSGELGDMFASDKSKIRMMVDLLFRINVYTKPAFGETLFDRFART